MFGWNKKGQRKQRGRMPEMMMNFLQLLLLCVWLIFMPTLIGTNVSIRTKKYKDSFALAYISGLSFILAVFWVIALPMILLKARLTWLSLFWGTMIVICGLLSFLYNRKDIQQHLAANRKEWGKIAVENPIVCFLFLILFSILLWGQFTYFQPGVDNYIFVQTASDAYFNDSLLWNNPLTGLEEVGWDSYWQQVFSPIALFFSMLGRLSFTHPTIIIHTCFSFFFALACFSVYYVIGLYVLHNDKKFILKYLIVVSFFLLFGYYTSFPNITFALLLAPWTGKSIFVCILFPLYLYAFWNYEEDRKELIFLFLSICTILAILTVYAGGILFIILFSVLTSLLGRKERWRKQWKLGIAFLFFCLLSLSPVYERKKALLGKENSYGISQDVVDLGDYMTLIKEEPLIIAPNELLPYIRQYKGKVKLLYGNRETSKGRYSEIYDTMEMDYPDIHKLGQTAVENKVDIIIFNTDKHRFSSSPGEYGYDFGGNFGSYDFYIRR